MPAVKGNGVNDLAVGAPGHHNGTVVFLLLEGKNNIGLKSGSKVSTIDASEVDPAAISKSFGAYEFMRCVRCA